MLVHQHKRLVLVPLVFHPFQGKVGDDISRISDMLDHFVVLSVPILVETHGWIVVRALPHQNFRIVVSLWGHVRAEMPFAHHRGGVACLTQKFGEGLLRSIEFVSVNQKTIGMRIFTRLYRRPHRSADGVGHIALLKEHTIPS